MEADRKWSIKDRLDFIAVAKGFKLSLAPIVRPHPTCEIVILAQSEADYDAKCKKINNGDTNGFYTFDTCPKLTPPPSEDKTPKP